MTMEAVAEINLSENAYKVPPGAFKAICITFALVGVFNRADWTERGEEWVVHVAKALEEVGDDWVLRWFPELLREVKAVLLGLTDGESERAGAEVADLEVSGTALALTVARSAREAGRFDRAEAWYARARELARRVGEEQALVRAKLGMGWVHLQREQYTRARDCFRDAEDHARERGLSELEGMACHDLSALAVVQNRHDDVLEYARRARRAYGDANPRLIRLSQNIAYHWSDRGQFHEALPVFGALLKLPAAQSDPESWTLLLCATVRAAAGCDDQGIFRGLWGEAWAAVTRASFRGRAAPALLDLAEAALLVGDSARAGAAGRAALHLARELSQDGYATQSEELLARAQLPGAVEHGRGSGDSVTHSLDQAVCEELVQALRSLQNSEGEG
jgi:tetratricopeptide (TPR) repeat protein